MKFFKIFAIVLVLVGSGLTFAPTKAESDQCPDGQKFDYPSGSKTVNGVTITWSGHEVVVEGGTAQFCVKADNSVSGIITLTDGTWKVDWLNGGGQIADISHLVLYGAEPHKTSTPKPTKTPTPEENTPTVTNTSPPPTITKLPDTPTPADTRTPVISTNTPTLQQGTGTPVIDTVTPVPSVTATSTPIIGTQTPAPSPTVTNTPPPVPTDGPKPTPGAGEDRPFQPSPRQILGLIFMFVGTVGSFVIWRK